MKGARQRVSSDAVCVWDAVRSRAGDSCVPKQTRLARTRATHGVTSMATTSNAFSSCQSRHPASVEASQGPLLDADGKKIEAHGAGLLIDPRSSRVYWYGESMKSQDFRTHAITV